MGPARWARGHGSREGADRLGGWGLGRGPHWPPLARVALSWSSTTVGFGFTRFSWSLVPGSWDFSVFFLFHFLGLGCPVWERPECNGYCSEMLVAVFLFFFVFLFRDFCWLSLPSLVFPGREKHPGGSDIFFVTFTFTSGTAADFGGWGVTAWAAYCAHLLSVLHLLSTVLVSKI